MQGWYFLPSLKHYRVIKTVTDTGSVRSTNNFNLKNHAINPPEVTPTEKIVKATHKLAQNVQTKNDTLPDKL